MWNFRNLDARAIVLRLKAYLLQDDLLKMLEDTLAGFVGDGFLEVAGTDTLGTTALSDTSAFAPAGTDTLGTGSITDSVSATV